jgi:hypothetical protein
LLSPMRLQACYRVDLREAEKEESNLPADINGFPSYLSSSSPSVAAQKIFSFTRGEWSPTILPVVTTRTPFLVSQWVNVGALAIQKASSSANRQIKSFL